MTETVVVPVLEASGAAEARRAAAGLATQLGFDETDAGRVAILVTEAATNLTKHAGGGALLFNALHANGHPGIEILGLDTGPGIADIGRSLRDGYSTTGSPGTGLGAMRRLAQDFEIYSQPGAGTAVLARVWPRTAGGGQSPLEVAGLCVTKAGESVCGDAWAASEHQGSVTILIADGVGHGDGAAAAAREAIRLFRVSPGVGPTALLERLNAGLRATRGAAAAATHVDLKRRLVTFAGVGNISGTILDGGLRSLASHNGTLGQEARRIREFQYPWPSDGLLILHTDGLASHWSLDRYPGLVSRHPSLIAGVLYRDFKRGRDDVTVVVARKLPL